MFSFSRFMQGRYGTDNLNRFLLVVYLVVWVVANFFRGHPVVGPILAVVLWGMVLWLLFRTFSRNIPRRQAENRWFLRWWNPTKWWFAYQGRRLRDIRRYRYRKCPGCGVQMRLPIKRGRRTVTCHRCRAQFKTFFL
ncbi:MAG: hypothetical protein E7527_03010 [Ruminococcaceae bacterium]|nr:hypothetical protein [Oscillospiraceae bacterium]